MSEPMKRMPGLLETSSLRDRDYDYIGEASEAERAEFAARAEVPKIEALRFEVQTRPWRKGVWIEGQLTATVEQECVATLKPVITEVKERFERGYLPSSVLFDDQRAGLEIEITDDSELGDAPEPLADEINLSDLLFEVLTLALPDYPRVPDVDEIARTAEPEGAEPLNEDNIKPFAELKALRDRLSGGEGETP